MVVPNDAYVVSDERNAFLVLRDVSYFYGNTFSSEVFVLPDVSPFRNLTLCNVLVGQVSSFCNLPSFCVACKWQPEKAVTWVQRLTEQFLHYEDISVSTF